MNLVPCPVMKNHSSHEDGRPLQGYQRNERSKWKSLYRRLAHSQPYVLVLARSNGFIAEDLGVMLVMSNRVSLKHALEGRSTHTEEVASVHQLAVHLVLDKGHQHGRENNPATNLQKKGHQIVVDAFIDVNSAPFPRESAERASASSGSPRPSERKNSSARPAAVAPASYVLL